MTTEKLAPADAGAPIRLPEGSRASRRIGMKSRVSVRGFLIARMAAAPDGRRVCFESALERDFLLLSLARPDVVDIVEQPFCFNYVDRNGRSAHYTPDFLVTLADGRRLAVEVKRAERAQAASLGEKLALVAAQICPSHADGLHLFTDVHFQPWEALNAAQVHECKKTIDRHADEALSGTVKNVHGIISIGDLVQMSGLSGRTFRAVVRAIFAGKLRLVTPGIISPASRVMKEVRA